MASSPSTPTQIALFSLPEAPDAFRKATQILHSTPRMPVTLLQRKIQDAWTKNAIENEPDEDGWWQLSIAKLADDVGFDSNNREYLRASADALMHIVYEWDVMAPANKRAVYKASVLFPEIEIHPHYIRYQVSSQLRSVMTNPEVYAIVDQTAGRKFRRGPAYALWQFCSRYERIGQTSIVPWERLRDMILSEGGGSTYDQYKFFKSKVLTPSIAEINEVAHIEVELVEGKEGKRVVSLQFKVRRKLERLEEVEADGRAIELIGEMVKLGLPQSEARRITRTNDLDAVKGAVDYTKRRMTDHRGGEKLERPAAYFRRALEQRYADSVEKPALSAAAAPAPSVDLKERYLVDRQDKADGYFRELDTPEQEQLVERYNAQQSTEALKLKKRVNKANQTAFLRWLATDLWGEVGDHELVEYAQQLLS
jgi:hypothetical protein